MIIAVMMILKLMIKICFEYCDDYDDSDHDDIVVVGYSFNDNQDGYDDDNDEDDDDDVVVVNCLTCHLPAFAPQTLTACHCMLHCNSWP